MHSKLPLSLILLISIACLLAGCATLPTTRDLRIQLGFERPLVHQDVPAAPPLSGAVRQSALGQTERIIIQDEDGRMLQTVTDPVLIQNTLTVLRNVPHGAIATTPNAKQHVVIVHFYLTTPNRTVTLRYDPSAEAVQIFNIPNQAWPDHIVADYQVSTHFGAAFRDALQLTP